MDALIELLKMVVMLGAAFLALAWLGTGGKGRIGETLKRRSKGRRKDDPNGPIIDDMGEIGLMGGLGGGSMEDVFIGRHALRGMKIGARARRAKAKAKQAAKGDS